jgi:aerobic-type carbon monoxide dehydrogenase small subunit (CoxS/CutS family)
VKEILNLRVNNQDYEVLIEQSDTLVKVLREDIGLTGTKEGCNTGNCGVCTVLIDGKAVKSCLVLASQAKGKQILTIEGLGEHGLHPLQQAFIDHFAVQCGYCTPGMILAAKALLDENPNPTEDDVIFGLGGNYCRCTGYRKIIEAVLATSKMIRGE